MSVVTGVVKKGRVELDAPADWPEGAAVRVELTEEDDEKIGLDESEWDGSPDGIARRDRWLDTFQPLELSELESRELEEGRAKSKAYTIQKMKTGMENNPWP